MERIFLMAVVCVISTRGDGTYGSVKVVDNALQFKVPNEAGIDDTQWIVINRTSQAINKIFTKKDECSRYCIEGEDSNDKVPPNLHRKRINFIWHISDNLPEFNKNALSLDNQELENSNGPEISGEKCEIQLSIGCKNSINGVDRENADKLEILRKTHLTGFTSNKFNVHLDADHLQLRIEGNVTWIFLEIPAGRRNGMEPLGLSLVRADGNGVNLIANNPPPGGWLLKLRGRENSTYSLTAWQVVPLDTPEPLAALQDDDKLNRDIENDGIVIFLEDMETPESRQASLRFPSESSDLEGNRNYPKAVVFQEPLDELSKFQIEENADAELRDLSRSSGLITRGKSVPVDLSPETKLLVKPGTIHTIIFTVTNNQAFALIHEFHPSSTQFQIRGIEPRRWWIQPDQTIKVGVHVEVPLVDENIVNTVTLHVKRSENLDPVQKSAYMYLQRSSNSISDSTKPTIDYEFSNNCAGRLRLERCENNFWSVDITVTDDNSGLKRVASQPNGVHSKREFIAGTKNAVHFLYTSTCCYTKVEVTATDVVGNTHSRTIDVTAWDNLSTGEIVAIVLGSLFLLLIIILLILLCIHCIRKRRSADISYSQRYGSRGGPSSRAEGTNF
uniref:PERK1_1 protein n=1 Tax=Fopius arisanus TaxID=64838 RepID=A0A0C9QIX7_9HYME